MNIDELRELLRILDERGIAEFELDEGERKLRVRKHVVAPAAPVFVAPPVAAPSLAALPAVAPVAAPSPAPVAPAAPPAPAPADSVADGLVRVTSPIVGTFYRAPDPNSPPFINVGDRVRLGQVLCIVEAMKLMNEIEAETAGEIVKIFPENGQPVQYGDPLFALRPER